MRNNKGVILTLTVIFVLILIIMAGVALLLWTNHARVTERQIKRMRAFYTGEAAMVSALDELRRTNTLTPNPKDIPLNPLTANVVVSPPDAQGIRTVTTRVNY